MPELKATEILPRSGLQFDATTGYPSKRTMPRRTSTPLRHDFSPGVACRRVGFPPPARGQRRPPLMVLADAAGWPPEVEPCSACFPDSGICFCAPIDGPREATLSTVFWRSSNSPRNARQIFIFSSPKAFPGTRCRFGSRAAISHQCSCPDPRKRTNFNNYALLPVLEGAISWQFP
jgi:hypothetical protein